MDDRSEPGATTERVTYTGRVQGVGFRYTVREIAMRHPVAGYVKNLSDGSVELVAQGAAAEVERFLNEIAARFRANIRGVDRRTINAAEEFAEFDIRF